MAGTYQVVEAIIHPLDPAPNPVVSVGGMIENRSPVVAGVSVQETRKWWVPEPPVLHRPRILLVHVSGYILYIL